MTLPLTKSSWKLTVFSTSDIMHDLCVVATQGVITVMNSCLTLNYQGQGQARSGWH